MMNALFQEIQQAVENWGRDYFQADELVIYILQEDDDDPERYIAIMAVPNQETWQAAEVWVEEGGVASINHLGEGGPPDDAACNPGSAAKNHCRIRRRLSLESR